MLRHLTTWVNNAAFANTQAGSFCEAAKRKGIKVLSFEHRSAGYWKRRLLFWCVRHADIKVLEYSTVPAMKSYAANWQY